MTDMTDKTRRPYTKFINKNSKICFPVKNRWINKIKYILEMKKIIFYDRNYHHLEHGLKYTKPAPVSL